MKFVIKAGQFIDGSGASLRKRMVILIEGGRIVSIFDEGTESFPPDVEVLEYPQSTVLPGLIDAHVHSTFDPDAYDTIKYLMSATKEEMRVAAEKNLSRYIKAGVTTIRELGAMMPLIFELREDAEAGKLNSPRIVASGLPITIAGGHGSFGGLVAAGPEQVRSHCEKLISAGVDVIKVMGTGGGVTPGSNPLQTQFNHESLSLIVGIAHEHGLRVAVHSHTADSISECLKGGVDTIEHCMFVTPRGIEPDEELIDKISQSDVYVTPTSSPFYVLRDSDDPILGFPQFGFTPRWLCDKALNLLEKFRQAGVKVITGSDSGTYKLYPESIHAEFAALSEAGFSAMDIICATTSRAAEALGMEGKTGTLIPGKLADLIVVPGDPLHNLGVLKTPQMVMKAGKIAFESNRPV